jgi:hypothetical protein
MAGNLGKRLLVGVGALLAMLALSASARPGAAHAEASYFSFCAQADRVCVEGTQVAGPVGAEFCEGDPNGSSHPNAAACVDKANDQVWVDDTAEDSRSGMAYVLGSGGTWYICRNKHGNGSWARCNFDWPEGRSFDLYLSDWDFSAGVGSNLWYVRTFND